MSASTATMDFGRIGEVMEDALDLAEVAAETRTSRVTVARWLAKGLKVGDGRTIKLASLKVGSKRYVRREDLALFLAACNEPT